MTEDSKCANCGRTIPSDAPMGQCPFCLMELADEDEASPKTTWPVGHDRNLLFGVLALQLRLIGPKQFLDAAAGWGADPKRSISERLAEMGALKEGDAQLVDGLVLEAIELHDGDEHVTLERFGGESRFDEWLSELDDDERSELKTRLGIPLDVEDVDSSDYSAVLETPGRYTRKSEYSRGGMGRILLVHDEYLSRDIALKELIPNPDPSYSSVDGVSPMHASSTLLVRFLREAKVTGQLEHPSIVPVYELGRRSDGTLYYTMKLVRGQTLAEALRHVSTTQERLSFLSHFLDLCQAIGYAHSRNVIHRDIKPANVMIGEFGETVVIDWGLAKVVGQDDIHEHELRATWSKLRGKPAGDPEKTAPGARLGTPHYMSPEQAMGRIDELDQRTDVFALGSMLYVLLSGKVPFEGKTTEIVFDNVVAASPKPVREIVPDVSAELASVCEKAMSKDPDKRYADAKELATEVQRFLTGAAVHAYEYSTSEVLARIYRRHRPLINAMAASIVLLLILGTVSFISIRNARDDAVLARDAEIVARLQSRENEYVALVRLAHENIQNAKYDEAQEVLWKTPPDERNWEWGHLLYRAYQPIATLRDATLSALHPEGKLIARASATSPLSIYDVETKETIATLHTSAGSSIHLEFLPAASRLLSLNMDGNIEIWDTLTWLLVAELPHPGQFLSAIDVNAENTRVATATTSGRVRLWNIDDSMSIMSEWDASSSEESDYAVITLAVAAGGERVAGWLSDSSRTLNLVKIWDEDGQLTSAISSATKPKFATSSSTLVAVDNRDILVWREENPDQISRLSGHKGKIQDLQFAQTDEFLVSASEDKSLRTWDLSVGSTLRTFQHGENIREIALSTNARYLAATSLDGQVSTWSISDGIKLTSRRAHEGSTIKLEFSADGERFMTHSGTDETRLWYTRMSPGRRTVQNSVKPIKNMSISAGGKYLSVRDGRGLVSVQDLAQPATVTEFRSPETYYSSAMAVSPDEEELAVVLDGFSVLLFDISSRSLLHVLIGGQGKINSVAFSPDSSKLLSASVDSSILLWNTESGKLIKDFEGHESSVLSVAFSPSEDIFASASRSGKIVVRSLSTFDELESFTLDDSAIHHISFAPTSGVLASFSVDGKIQILPIGNSNLKAIEPLHLGRLTDGGLSSTGQRIFSVGASGEATLWDSDTGDEVLTIGNSEYSFSLGAFDIRSRAFFLAEPNGSIIRHETAISQPFARYEDKALALEQFEEHLDEYYRSRMSPIERPASVQRLTVLTKESLTNLTTMARTIEDGLDQPELAGVLISPQVGQVLRGIGVESGEAVLSLNSTEVDSIDQLLDLLDQVDREAILLVRTNGVDSSSRIRLVQKSRREKSEISISQEDAVELLEHFRNLHATYEDVVGANQQRLTQSSIGGSDRPGIWLHGDSSLESEQLYARHGLSVGDRIINFDSSLESSITSALGLERQSFVEKLDEALNTLRRGSPYSWTWTVERGLFQEISFSWAVS